MAFRAQLAGRVNAGNLKWFTLGAACFGLFMAILDNLVVNIALPTISRDLDASTTQLQWIVSAYTLIFASLQITAGGLGDRLGRKRWFLIGLVIFTAASAMSALSQNIEMLLAGRAIQGLGAALIMPLSLSIISEAFPPEERGKALGIWSAVSVSGLALGPIVGGFLVEYASWHWVFIINIPIGILAFFVTSAVVKESRDTSGTVAMDIPGTALITAGIASLTWGLIEAGNRGWGDTWIVTSLIAAAVFAVAFVVVESRTEKPMVPLRFFKSTTFTGTNIDAFMISFLLAGVSFFFTLFLQNVHGYSPVRSGLSLLPLVFAMMILSPISGAAVNRIGSRRLISAGMLVTGIGNLLMLLSGVDTSYYILVPSLIVMGLGMSLIFAPMTTAMLNSVDNEKSGVASAVNGAIREIGTATGIALLGTVMNRVYQTHFNASDQVQALRAAPGGTEGPLAHVINMFGSGAAMAGHVIDDMLPAAQKAQLGDVVDQIRLASSHAFVAGMDRAVIVASAAIFVAAVVSFFLVRDSVADKAPAPEAETESREKLAAAVAD